MAALQMQRHLGNITCPVYGFYGESDNRINSTIESTKTAAASADITYEPVIYADVGHGFLEARNGCGGE